MSHLTRNKESNHHLHILNNNLVASSVCYSTWSSCCCLSSMRSVREDPMTIVYFSVVFGVDQDRSVLLVL